MQVGALGGDPSALLAAAMGAAQATDSPDALKSQVGAAVLSKAMDSSRDLATRLLDSLQTPNTGVGRVVDVKA